LLYTSSVKRPSHHLSAGAVVVRETEGGTRFLLLRAYDHWDFPKGLVEPGEGPLAAAIREVREETTLDDLEFPWGESFTETGPYSRGKIARYYLARTRKSEVSLPVNPDIGAPEHHEFRWVDQAEALRLVSPRVRPVVTWAAEALGIRTVLRSGDSRSA
jgi:8-oxo-dGTP pyrophosphatase MutT (NUDIX family)